MKKLSLLLLILLNLVVFANGQAKDFKITGRVIDVSGNPVQKALVYFYPVSESGTFDQIDYLVLVTKTDMNGHFESVSGDLSKVAAPPWKDFSIRFCLTN